MREETIPPFLARQMAGEPQALAGPGKIVFAEHEKSTVFAGVACGQVSAGEKSNDWRMSVGTLLWVPCAYYRWADKRGCGWRLEDLVTGGLDAKHWKKEVE